MIYRYLPAYPPSQCMSPTMLTPSCHLDERCRESWGVAYYPYALWSYALWGDLRRPHHPIPADAFLVGDSGGYSAMTRGWEFSPEDVIRWQIQWTKIGFLLDMPPFSHKQGLGQSVGWDAGLRKTVWNTRRALPLYQQHLETDHPFRWWGIVQGRTRREIMTWRDAVARVYPFLDEGEGWGFSNVGTSTELMGYIFGLFQRLGLRHIHSLGTSWGRGTVALCLGILGDFETVMFDSSSASLTSVIRMITIQNGPSYKVVNLEEKDKDPVHPATDYLMQCPCASCRDLRRDYPDGPPRVGRYLSRRMHMHSLLTLRQATDAAYREAVRDPERLLREELGEKKAVKVLRAFAGHEPGPPRGRPRGTSLLEWA